MDISMERWYDAVKKRVSVRKYSGDPSKDEIAYLSQVADYLSSDEVRIVVGKKAGVFESLIAKTISGTNTYAAVITHGKEDEEYLAGTSGEAFVLECTSIGLGTCWLGISYNKSVIASAVKLKKGEKVRCVISIGHFSEKPTHKRSRKTIYNLTGLEEKAYKKVENWQKCAVETGRLAPSARNVQPWEFDILSGAIQVACVSGNFGYGALDCGIAMLHIELGAAHCGVYGSWEIKDRLPVFTADNEA